MSEIGPPGCGREDLSGCGVVLDVVLAIAGGIFLLLAPGAGDSKVLSPAEFSIALMIGIGLILIALARISWQLHWKRPPPPNPRLIAVALLCPNCNARILIVDRPGQWRCPRCRALLESVIQPGADRVDGLTIVKETP